ncbi:Cytochrome c [Planctomycetes bacterium CA13]|uniref:Cytochrome c n=1 Tax=Novipirellula herctigrandis TaxID=2527986 RepID=A0A5C5Z7Z9_9BACT|nr:Cytochrome c [Planctomycetes bacterium CA13]
MFRSYFPLGFATLVCAGLSGCREQAPVAYEPNIVHAMKYEIQEGFSMDQASEDANWVVTEMFGTPNEPKIPSLSVEGDTPADIGLVSIDRLIRASGAPDEEGRGLYRKHCSLCHGLTGNGRGTTAAILNPYPRDYRMGIFKFKSTPLGAKPAREDLARAIRNGIAGTAMNKIAELSEEDVQALTDYVIFLSWRGELERSLIDDAIYDLDIEAGERIINSELANSSSEEDKETFDEQWGYAVDTASSIADSWLEAEEETIEVPDPPADLPVAGSYKEYTEMLQGEQAEAMKSSVEKGQAFFVGKIASCSKCHGEKGLGNGQTTDYDDWTKDWTSRIGLKPEERDTLVPLLARGALPPINAIPRNFAEGIFHGGSESEDLYRRITQGIDGTPMPAATFVDGEFEEADVWHLINFIRSLQTTDHDTSTDPEITEAVNP